MDNNTKKIKVQGLEKVPLPADVRVKTIRQGKEHVEVVYMAVKPKPGIKKLKGGNEYLVISTGEIKEFTPNETKIAKNLRYTFDQLKKLIRTNFTDDAHNQVFITLTYDYQMEDMDKLYTDFNSFIKRLKYTYRNKHKFEYIAVAEPMEIGRWHMHVMLKSVNCPVLFIDNVELTKIWGLGRTDIERLKSTDVGQYYTTYFTALTESETGIPSEDRSKKHKKGERIPFYPVGKKLYRCSRGITRPDESMATVREIRQEYPYRTNIDAVQLIEVHEDKEDKVINTIHKESYQKRDPDPGKYYAKQKARRSKNGSK